MAQSADWTLRKGRDTKYLLEEHLVELFPTVRLDHLSRVPSRDPFWRFAKQ